MYLAYAVDVKVAGAVQRLQHAVGLPAHPREAVLEKRASLLVRRGQGGRRSMPDQQHECPVVAHANARNLAAGNPVADISISSTVLVTSDCECSEGIAKEGFEPVLRPEEQRAHTRVEPIGADHNIEELRG
jgi:hypothetical protein